jgi:hypothetical protein
VARFSDDGIRAIVGRVGFDDPQAAEHVARVLIERRNAVARAWLNGVNPIVDASLARDGRLAFSNAAVDAGAATPAAGYTLTWSRFDNDSGQAQTVGAPVHLIGTVGMAPLSLLGGAEFVVATIRGEHPDHPAWARPVQVYFRRGEAGWKTVGLFRQP